MADSDDDEIGTKNEKMSKELLFACKNGKVDLASECLKKGASLSYTDNHGWNSFHWCASNGHVNALRVLLENCKTDSVRARYVNTADQLAGWTPLHAACVGNHVSCIKELIHAGSKIDTRTFLGEYPFECCGTLKSSLSAGNRALLHNLLSVEQTGGEDEGKESDSKSPSPEVKKPDVDAKKNSSIASSSQSPAKDSRYANQVEDDDDEGAYANEAYEDDVEARLQEAAKELFLEESNRSD